MQKAMLFPILLLLAGAGIAVMSITGMLDVSHNDTFVQGEIDGTRIDVSAKFSARVLKAEVKDGQPVAAGQRLLLLDSPEMEAKVKQAEEAVKNAHAQLEKLRNGVRSEELRQLKSLLLEATSAATLARQNFGRQEELHKIHAVSTQSFDEARDTLQRAEARERKARAALDEAIAGTRYEDIAVAEARARELEGALTEIRSTAADMTLCSPTNGEISKVLVEKGELISAGYPLATLVDLSDLWAVVLLREDQLSRIRMGQKVTGIVPALDKRKITFTIDYIAPMGNFATWRATNHSGSYDLKTFEVRGHPAEATEGLRPGMSVIFPLSSVENTGSE